MNNGLLTDGPFFGLAAACVLYTPRQQGGSAPVEHMTAYYNDLAELATDYRWEFCQRDIARHGRPRAPGFLEGADSASR
jgi:hypothetical protein